MLRKKMKNFFVRLLIGTVLCAHSYAMDDSEDQKKSKPFVSVSLNKEAEQVVDSILTMNRVTKEIEKMETGDPLFKQDISIQNTKKIAVNYVEDLSDILSKIKKERNQIKRKEIINNIDQKNNPFSTFYY